MEEVEGSSRRFKSRRAVVVTPLYKESTAAPPELVWLVSYILP